VSVDARSAAAAAGRPPSAALRIARALLLLAMGGALAAALTVPAAVERRDSAARAGSIYSCPMHPEVALPTPGACPICRMALVARPGRARAARGGAASPPSRAAAPPQRFSLLPETASPPDRFFNRVNRVLVSRTIVAAATLDQADVGAGAAHLYRDEAATLATDERATFVLPARAPGQAVARWLVRFRGATPAPWDEATVVMRFEAAGPVPPSARAGAVGWVELPARTRPTLLVPAGAIVRSAGGSFVFVAAPDGRTFTKRPVVPGRTFFGAVAVVSGLGNGERVVIGGAPFLEAERLLAADDAVAAAP